MIRSKAFAIIFATFGLLVLVEETFAKLCKDRYEWCYSNSDCCENMECQGVYGTHWGYCVPKHNCKDVRKPCYDDGECCDELECKGGSENTPGRCAFPCRKNGRDCVAGNCCEGMECRVHLTGRPVSGMTTGRCANICKDDGEFCRHPGECCGNLYCKTIRGHEEDKLGICT